VGALAFVALAGPGAAALGGDEAFRCALKESHGVPQADADTAAQLICEQLRRASGSRGAFGITLASLGKVVVVTAAREEPAASVTVQVECIEEVPVAAERIAQALVKGLAFAATQRVDNLLEDETRQPRVKKGSLKFTAGVLDVESPRYGARAAGFSLGLLYSSSRFALPAELHFAWNNDSYGQPRKYMSLFSLSVGGRFYLSKRNVSPFVGGGLGILNMSVSEGDYPSFGGPATGYFDAERFGVAPYVEVGVEMLRLHRARVGFQVRADFPTGALQSSPIELYSSWDDRGGRPPLVSFYPAQSRYVVPVSIGVTVAF
jgi:hypothetical protein